MKILMICLDKNILDPQSSVATRMVQYGQHDEIFIIIPASEEKNLDLSPVVHVLSTGGNNKFIQFFKIFGLGRRVIKEKQIEEITAQDPFFIGLLGWLLKIFSGVRLEVQLHGDFFGSSYYGWRIWFGKWVVRRADKLRAVGERIKNSLLSLGISEKRITVRPIEVILVDSIRFFSPRIDVHEKYGRDKKIFLAIGRLEKVKNLSWLIDVFGLAVTKKTEMLLLIVGSGADENILKEKVKKSGLVDNIKFENWTTDPLSYIKTADCLVVSSLSEGYGLTAMEASALGSPVIMTDVGVANYELQPGLKVKIVQVWDKYAFAGAMLVL